MKFKFLLVLPLLTTQLSAQCDTSVVFGNDSTNAVCFETIGNVTTVYTNNYPDHSYGSWPSGSPVGAFSYIYHFCAYPQKDTQSTDLYNAHPSTPGCTPYTTVGVGTNGIYYAAWGARWFVDTITQVENLDWNVEPTAAFNMGFNNAHSTGPGEYHYHGVPVVYFEDSLNIDGTTHSPIVGYAADGFPMYYKYAYSDPMDSTSGVSTFTSGYTLKQGNRPGDGASAPDGVYDGLYVEDYEYLDPAWDLDECNGRYGVTPDYPDGTYYYVLTDNWPYIPRCFYGTTLDNSFRIGPNCPASTADIDCSAPIVSQINILENASISVYPNPSSSTIQIFSNDYELYSKVSQVSIYDITGKVWYSANQLEESVDISSFAPGNYFLQIIADNNQVTKKIIVR